MMFRKVVGKKYERWSLVPKGEKWTDERFADLTVFQPTSMKVTQLMRFRNRTKFFL